MCKTPGARFHIRIGPRAVSCNVDIPFDLNLTKEDAVSLENKMHDAIEAVLQAYWVCEEEFELDVNETFEDLLERRLRGKNESSL